MFTEISPRPLLLFAALVLLPIAYADAQEVDVPLVPNQVVPATLTLAEPEDPEELQAFVGVLAFRGGIDAAADEHPFKLCGEDGCRLVAAGKLEKRLLPYVGQRLKVVGTVVAPGKGELGPAVAPAHLTVLKPVPIEEAEALPPFVEATAPASLVLDRVGEDLAEAEPDEELVEVEILARIPHSGRESPGIPLQPKGKVITSQEELVKLLGRAEAEALPKRLGLDDEKIDFDRYSLIHVYGGKRSTGGYRVEIEKVTLNKQANKATVHWKLYEPEGFATQVISYPGQLALVERFEANKVEFVPRAEPLKEPANDPVLPPTK